MADRAARQGCAPCAAAKRARQEREAAAKSGTTTPAGEKSAGEALIATKPAGR